MVKINYFFLKFKKRVFQNKAIIYGLSSKLWTIFSGTFTISLVVFYFTKTIQGFYYTFASLLALQTFAELGLGFVIQQFASHEWANLKYDRKIGILGDSNSLSRLRSIAKISFKWYFIAGSISIILLSIFGSYFFYSTQHNYNIWFTPWIILSCISGMTLMLTPFWSILEGCNQVNKLYGFRLIQSILINVFTWVSVISNFGLWSIIISGCVTILCSLYFIIKYYNNFFKELFKIDTSGPFISWKNDMFNMQYKLALSWIFGYFSSNLFIPLIFKYKGPELAGQFGMTFSIISVICSLGLTIVTIKTPSLAIYGSKKDYINLNKLFNKLYKTLIFSTLSLTTFFYFFIIIANFYNIHFFLKIISRMLPISSIFLLLFAYFSNILSVPFSIYMRTFKVEPVMILSIIQSILISISVFFSLKYFSLNIMIIFYFIINFFILALIFKKWKIFKNNLT